MAKGSNTFGGTVKLDGESEYRKALSNITAQLGVVGSEMKKVTAEFGKNDKSIESLSKKDDILKIGNYQAFDKMEDYYIWLKLIKENFQMKNIPEVLVNVRIDKNMFLRRGGYNILKVTKKF